jgi:DNA-binding MarR family transcriptional regulator
VVWTIAAFSQVLTALLTTKLLKCHGKTPLKVYPRRMPNLVIGGVFKMNVNQQKILYILKKKPDRYLAPVIENFNMNVTLLSLELEKLERQGLVEIVRANRERIKKVKITERGEEALEEAIVLQTDIPLQKQVHELREIVDTLQLAIDEINTNRPKDKNTIDKLNKYLSAANGIPTLIKTISELYGKAF